MPLASQIEIPTVVAHAFQFMREKESPLRSRDSEDDTVVASLNPESLLEFVMTAVQPSSRLMCTIKRNRRGMRNSYRLLLQRGKNEFPGLDSSTEFTHLMGARKFRTGKMAAQHNLWCSPDSRTWRERTSIAKVRKTELLHIYAIYSCYRCSRQRWACS
jgi:hypothetical protein